MSDIVYGMNEAEYHQIDAASNSTLSRMAQSPAHCRTYLDEPYEQTAAQRLGSLVHKLVLEPDDFDSAYIQAPTNINRRTNAGKEQWAAFEESAKGRTVIAGEELETARLITDSVMAHPAASRLLAGGHSEVSAFWRDERTGFDCKCRFDKINTRGYIVDLKTTADASLDNFARSIAKFGYHRQNAMYSDGYQAAFNRAPRGFVFVAVETKPPYAVAVYNLSPVDVDRGRDEYQALLQQYAECVATDNWPAYPDTVQTIELPRWYQ